MTPRPNILIVDDAEQDIAPVMRYLSIKGYWVHGASRVAEARRLIERKKFDLILLDAALPDMRGLKALGMLRELSSAPIIIISADTHPDIREDALRLGAADTLSKPFDPDILLSTVRNNMGAVSS